MRQQWVFFFLFAAAAWGGEAVPTLPAFGNSVQEFYLEAFRKNHAERKVRLEAVKTRADAERYAAEARKRVRDCFHFPSRKSPLAARTTGRREFAHCFVENVLFQSRENFTVSGSLFLPKGAEKGGCPAVLILSGHASEGKVYYQPIARKLAACGIAAFLIDAIGQGERHQFRTVPGFPQEEPDPVLEHNILGKQQLLVGEWLGDWRTYDAVRAVDYLETRSEIDPARIGVTGNSGGGTLTVWLAAVEDRIKAMAPGCYVTTWTHNVENELPADIEQMPPCAIREGLELADFLIAAAPRDCLLLGQKNDFFDSRGILECRDDLQKISALLGRDDSAQILLGEGGHEASAFLQKGTCDFFCRVFGMPRPTGEMEHPEEMTREELDASPGGEVSLLPGERLVRDFTRERAVALRKERKSMTRETLRETLKTLLSLDGTEVPPYRVLRPRFHEIAGKPIRQSRFGLETEPGRVMAVLSLFSGQRVYYHLAQWPRVTLYIPHLDAAMELKNDSRAKDAILFGLDVRGVGECRPASGEPFSASRFFNHYSYDYHYAALSLMLGKPYLGGKVHDILCAVELLSRHSPEIVLEARGQGCVPALIAAVLSDRVTKLRLIDCPESWESMAVSAWPAAETSPLSLMIPGVLQFFDIPDLKRAVAEKLLPCDSGN